MDDVYINFSNTVQRILKNLVNLKNIFLLHNLNNSQNSIFCLLSKKIEEKKDIEKKIEVLKAEIEDFKNLYEK